MGLVYVITAMSFLVPHFSINKKIAKLTSFVKTWSVYPYNTPIEINDIPNTISKMADYSDVELRIAVEKAQGIIYKSLDEVSNLL